MSVSFPSKQAEDNTAGRGIHLATALASGALLGLYFMRLHPTWSTNDDLGILMFLTGGFDGNPTWQVPFVSPLASLPLRLITAVFGVAGYSILLIFLVWVSCWSLSVSLISQTTLVGTVQILNLVLALGTVQIALLVVVLNFTFTVVAGITVAAIVASMALADHSGFSVGNFRKFINVIILSAGLSLRPSIGLLVLLLMIPVLLSLARTSALRHIASIVVLTFLSNGLLRFAHTAEYKSWLVYNSVRGSLHENLSVPQPSESLLEKLSWTDNDFRLFSSWLHFDQTRFGLDKLQIFANESQVGWTAEVRQLTFQDLQYSLSIVGPIAILVLALVCLKALDVRCRGGDRALFLSGIVSLLVTSILAVAVISRVRFPPRVEIPIAFATLLGSMVLLLRDRHDADQDWRSSPNERSANIWGGRLKFATYAILLLIVITQSVRIHSAYVEVGTSSRTERLANMARQEEIHSLLNSRDSSEVTLLGIPVEHRSPFSNAEILPSNTVSFGWPVGSPSWNQRLENLGIDLREALIQLPEDHGFPYKLSILSDHYPEALASYIQEETGLRVVFLSTSCVGSGELATCLWLPYQPRDN